MVNEMGMIQVYTGNGKGKTTASLGLALRACGHGFKVLMIQFMKGDREYGEVKAAHCLPNFELRQVGRDCFVNFKDPDPIDIAMVKDGWAQAKEAILSKNFDMVILDELNIALYAKLLPVQEVVDFLKSNSHKNVEIVLTGQLVPFEIVEIADLVTEMKEIKHYFNQGIHSRDGFDH